MARSPISVRLNDIQQRDLEDLGGGENASAVLQEGLARMARLRLDSAPLYARMVEDKSVEDAVDRAVSAACSELDELFPEGKGKEFKGIGSNFQGLLAEHIKAMLTGLESADRSWKTQLNALLATEWSLGRFPRGMHFEPDVGFAAVRLAKKHGQVDVFLDTEREGHSERSYIPLEKVSPGGLFTSAAACAKGVFEWMEEADLSPRDEDLRLCALRITDSGPLQVVAVAALAGEAVLEEKDYATRVSAVRAKA